MYVFPFLSPGSSFTVPFSCVLGVINSPADQIPTSARRNHRNGQRTTTKSTRWPRSTWSRWSTTWGSRWQGRQRTRSRQGAWQRKRSGLIITLQDQKSYCHHHLSHVDLWWRYSGFEQYYRACRILRAIYAKAIKELLWRHTSS